MFFEKNKNIQHSIDAEGHGGKGSDGGGGLVEANSEDALGRLWIEVAIDRKERGADSKLEGDRENCVR